MHAPRMGVHEAVGRLVADLVAIESVNPAFPGGCGEAGIARHIRRWCERAGLEVEVEEAAPGRPKVVATRRGRGDGPTLLLLAHTDTVGTADMDRPHDPRVEDGRLYGRGAYDMKGGLAAAMLAAAAVDGLAGDVVLAAVCDEEAGGTGTRALLRSGRRFDAAIVTEPTDLRVGIAHKGFLGFEIETIGVAAHGSRPDEGEDAILAMGPVLGALAALEQRLERGPRHPLLGRGSLHASLIEGGQEPSSYPARCLLTGEWRTVPGEDPLKELGAAVSSAAPDAEVRATFSGRAFQISPEEDIVRRVASHSGAQSGALDYWTDAALVAEAGIPAVLFGPCGGGAMRGRSGWISAPSAGWPRCSPGWRRSSAPPAMADGTAGRTATCVQWGSQFDTAAVLLPAPTSRVLTRELLYTAATAGPRAVDHGGQRGVDPRRGRASRRAGFRVALAAVG